jgi:hypothetical protein
MAQRFYKLRVSKARLYSLKKSKARDKAFLNPGVDALDLIKNSKQIAKKI